MQVNLEEKIYIALNKPVDYISSVSDKQGKSVLDLVNKNNYIGRVPPARFEWSQVYPVGRLDKDSEGLILLTNDDELENRLTRPRYEHEKEYEVTIDRPLTPDARAVLTSGMNIDNEKYQGIKIKKEFNKGKRTIITVIFREDKNRQIRKIFSRLGYNIFSLKQVRIGKLKLDTLPVGKWRFAKISDII